MRLVGDHAAPGAAYGLIDRTHVERGEGAQVDDLELTSLSGGCLGALERGLHRRAVGQHSDVVAGADHSRPEERLRRRCVVEVGLVGVVLPLGLEEDDRVVVGDGLLDHPVAVDRVGAGDDLEAGRVRELRLGALGVVLDRSDAAAEGDADDDWHLHLALRAVGVLRDLAHDLVIGGIDEAVELDLHDGAVAAQRHADRGADDAGLGERRVDDAVLAEVLLQAVGDAEDAAELADVLAHEQDLVVGLHGLAQAHVEALGESDLLGGRHQWAPSDSKVSE